MSYRDPNLDEFPPMIHTIEGVGKDYLVWTREMILRLLERTEPLRDRIDALEERER